jgi:hypothetical protein
MIVIEEDKAQNLHHTVQQHNRQSLPRLTNTPFTTPSVPLTLLTTSRLPSLSPSGASKQSSYPSFLQTSSMNPSPHLIFDSLTYDDLRLDWVSTNCVILDDELNQERKCMNDTSDTIFFKDAAQ